jgi:hypothetical protein
MSRPAESPDAPFLSQLDAFFDLLYANRSDEEKLFNLLSAASADQLCAALVEHKGGEVPALILKRVADRVLGPKWKTSFLELLCTKRVSDLTLAANIALYRALHRDSSSDARSAAMRNLLLSLHGAELSELKRAVDATDDHFDLQNSLSVLTEEDQAVVLRHFSQSAEAQAQARLVEAAAALERRAAALVKPASAFTPAQLAHCGKEVKMLSDIDDTLFVSLFDFSFPNGTIYPGIHAFYSAMDDGPGAVDGLPVASHAGDLVFLTARPEGVGGMFEDFTHRFLAKKGIAHATVLSGSLLTAIGSSKGMAAKKFDNFTRFTSVYPEYNFCFTGDSGQGDIMMGQQMLQSESKDLISLILIHDIVDRSGQPKNNAAQRQALRDEGVVLFDSYVEAALEAYRRRLISQAGLLNVVAEATREFDLVRRHF